MRIIQKELNNCFSGHCVAVDKILEKDEKQSKIMQNLQISTHDLFLVFCQFKDIMDIRLNKFKGIQNVFKPAEFLENISLQVRRQPGTHNMSIQFQINRKSLPAFISGDKHRINYILLKLIQNSIERSNEEHSKEILVKCSMMNDEEIVLFVEDDIVRLSEM
jgi:signal transduction histidine kinase